MQRLLSKQGQVLGRASDARRFVRHSVPVAASSIEGIDTLMVANRGEIACRVMRTCRKLGIETVAVYSEADAGAIHVREADQKFLLGPAPSAKSYLRMDKIFEAIEASGTDAVHPGYGFLSENSIFSDKLEQMGVKFVGPRKHAIEVMGDKLESKVAAEEAGVHIIPGFNGIVEDADHAISIANDIGYPVMLKASAGGGGKGMRVAWNDKETVSGFKLAKAEAEASFGDDRILVEKFIDNPRHIEIQLLGDSHGNYVYLNERECSIQRRNQKVIEEAPSTFIDPDTRRAMGEQAIQLARAVGYQSAGTVEFLVDSQKNFYFLEMNTRLQVEHPISECITGVDLVEQMIRVAAGQKLSITQDDMAIKGWAVESRVYAEDSSTYMPSIGRLNTYIEPKASNPGAAWPDVRVDTGVEEGSEISMFYDPMICKLITYGQDRSEALALMRKALDSYVIKGVQHNIPLLRDIIEQPHFISGDTSTNFLPETYPDSFHGYQMKEGQSAQLAASAVYMSVMRVILSRTVGLLGLLCVVSSIVGHTNYNYSDSATSSLEEHLAVTVNNTVHNVTIHNVDGDAFTVSVDGGEPVEVHSDWAPGSYLFNGSIGEQDVIIQALERDGQSMKLRFFGTVFDVAVRTQEEQKHFELFPDVVDVVNANNVVTPMPGMLISVTVAPGDVVAAGQSVAVIEAMKMQNSLVAPRAGVVKAVHFKAGEKLADHDVVLELEDEDKEDK